MHFDQVTANGVNSNVTSSDELDTQIFSKKYKIKGV